MCIVKVGISNRPTLNRARRSGQRGASIPAIGSIPLRSLCVRRRHVTESVSAPPCTDSLSRLSSRARSSKRRELQLRARRDGYTRNASASGPRSTRPHPACVASHSSHHALLMWCCIAPGLSSFFRSIRSIQHHVSTRVRDALSRDRPPPAVLSTTSHTYYIAEMSSLK